MKTFDITVVLKDDRSHSADIEAESLDDLLISMNENLNGKFFALRAELKGEKYVVIINSAEVTDIIIVEPEETSTTSATLS